MALKTRIKGLKMKARSRFKRAKAAAGSFNFTSARKAALKKAQEASARARKLASNSTAQKGAAMKARSKFKRGKAAATSAAGKATSAAKSRFAKAGGNTKALRAKMKVQSAAKTVRAASRSAVAVVKNRAGVSTKKQATKRLNSNQVEKVLKGSGNKRSGASKPKMQPPNAAKTMRPKPKASNKGGRGGSRGGANPRSRRMRSPILERGRKAFNRWNFNKRKNR
jgi:colicin import membrane protein